MVEWYEMRVEPGETSLKWLGNHLGIVQIDLVLLKGMDG